MSQSDRVLSPALKTPASSAGSRSRDEHHERSPSRWRAIEQPPLAHRDEALVVDERSEVRPAQVVESKLARLLKDASLPVSHLQMKALLQKR